MLQRHAIVLHSTRFETQEPSAGRNNFFAEICSGGEDGESVSYGQRLFGYQGVSIDIKRGSLHDLLTAKGFLFILGVVWTLAVGALGLVV